MYGARIAHGIGSVHTTRWVRRPFALQRRRAAIRDPGGYLFGHGAADGLAAGKGDVSVTQDGDVLIAEIAFAVDGTESGAVVAGVAVGEEGDALGWSVGVCDRIREGLFHSMSGNERALFSE